jgi:hypothetical protein
MRASEFSDLRTESAVANFLYLDKLLGCLRPLWVLDWLLKPFEVGEFSLLLLFYPLSVSKREIFRGIVDFGVKLKLASL